MDVQVVEGDVALRTGRPACDNCKSRKTKCDRGNPCSVCVTANLICKFSRRQPEKRQRVLLSAKYEDALQSVDQRLIEISATLQNVAARQELLPITTLGSSPSVSRQLTPAHLLDSSTRPRSFNGYSSFHSHVRDLERLVSSAFRDSSVQGLSDDGSDTQHKDLSEDSLRDKYPELADRTLPPMELTFRILRLVNREPQRLFTDVPVLDTDDLSDICQKIYLSQKDVSVFDWITLNVSLHQIMANLDTKHYLEVGFGEGQFNAIVEDLDMNCKVAIESLRLCICPSITACRATALLASYCVRSGHHHTASRLTTFAARLMLEMGFHRSPLDFKNKKSALFWHVFSMDKFLSFTSGQSATIHHYDVTTERRTTLWKHPLVISGLGHAFIDFAFLASQIHLQFFSASAKEAPPSTRIEHAASVAAQLQSHLEALHKFPYPDDPTSISVYECLSLMAYSYLTIAYDCMSADQGNLRHSDDLVGNARKALVVLLGLGRRAYSEGSKAWFTLLNACLAFTPLVPIVVLARYTIMYSWHNHLDLLKPVVDIIGCAETSPAIQEVLTSSTRLYQAAKSAVDRRSDHAVNKDAVM